MKKMHEQHRERVMVSSSNHDTLGPVTLRRTQRDRASIQKSWHNFFFREIPPHGLALIRIALGLFLLVYWCVYLPRVVMLFSKDGIVIPYSDSTLLTPPSASVAFAIYTAMLIPITALLLGWHMRTARILLCVAMLYYWLLSFHHFPSSYNRIILFVTFIIAMSGADKTLSLRMRQSRGSWSASEMVAAWPLRILAIQITALYLGVGLQKAYLPGWQGGEIISYSFINAWSTPLAYHIARLNIPMGWYDLAAWMTKILHGVLPIGLWIPWMQRWCFVGAALFHIVIALTMGMWWFLVLIPLYIAFVEPMQIQKLCRMVMSDE